MGSRRKACRAICSKNPSNFSIKKKLQWVTCCSRTLSLSNGSRAEVTQKERKGGEMASNYKNHAGLRVARAQMREERLCGILDRLTKHSNPRPCRLDPEKLPTQVLYDQHGLPWNWNHHPRKENFLQEFHHPFSKFSNLSSSGSKHRGLKRLNSSFQSRS